MQQVLFHIPFTGLPVYGFGAMLFVAFVVVTGWATWRLTKVGMPREKVQDLAIVLFLTGLLGARVLYMIQYAQNFPNKNARDLVIAFFSIWEGGIVFYGSVFGGLAGYLVYRHLVLKKLGINGWQLADAVAPLMAIGLAVGRVGCFLNGCCWGQVACEECQPVPLTADLGRFPLLPAHARKQVVLPPGKDARLPQDHGLQTATGFAVRTGDPAADPRTVVRVEPGSDAERAGLRAGDTIVEADGKPNYLILAVFGPESAVRAAEEKLRAAGGEVLRAGGPQDGGWTTEVGFTDRAKALAAQAAVLGSGADVTVHDTLGDLVRDGNWPRGKNELALVVERNGERVPVAYTPRTVTFFPTQVYESVSMVLLTLLLLAFQPFRRHDGQVIVLCMAGYAAHRFLNEAIRIEPTYALGLTLSQWISVAIFLAAVGLELYLRRTQPKLPPGAVPLGWRPGEPAAGSA